MAGSDELDTSNLCGRLIEGPCRRLETRGDGAAEVLTFGGDSINGYGGSKIDDDGRLPGKHVVRGYRIRDAVGADLARVVDLDRDPSLGSGLDNHRRKAKVPLGHLANLLRQRRHHRANRNPSDLAREREIR